MCNYSPQVKHINKSKMKKLNFWFLLGVSAIMIITGMCIADIGEKNSCGAVYDYTLPLFMFCFTAYFFFIGYFAGNERTK